MTPNETNLETLIVTHLRDVNGYVELTSHDYNKDYAVLPKVVEDFVARTQPDKVAKTACFASDKSRAKFFERLSKEISERGVVDVLRNGFSFNLLNFVLYYHTADDINPSAQKLYAENRFVVVRQLMYSKLNNNELDLMIAINGLPLMTMELKNSLTNQKVGDAVNQYKNDRNPKELLFHSKRCAVHMAVDDSEVMMCTQLDGDHSQFMPFNKGVNGGAGNPPNPQGLKTAYLWEEVLTKATLSEILENYAQVVKTQDPKTHRTKEKNIWPRYHQLDCVRSLVADTATHEIGQRYLIQHSAGSGKSHSITWLTYQLCKLKKADYSPLFNGVIILTDKVNLDKQIRNDILSFAKIPDMVGWASDSEDLRTKLIGGTPIVVTVINKFHYILDTIGKELKKNNYAIIIDEAHSSQGGDLAAAVSKALTGNTGSEEKDMEDRINEMVEGRRLATNANYYAFTATPKGKTLSMFGVPYMEDGEEKHRPFHEYTMKQAIEEKFILDVLKHYTTYDSFYSIVKTVENNPEFDRKKGEKKIRKWVEGRPETVAEKSRVIVEHYCKNVASKIGGKARAMVVTSSIERAIEYYQTITHLLRMRNSQYKAVVAFTDKEIGGRIMTCSELNGFPMSQIEEMVETEPYRILIVADMFQTGYDQPLMHTMYVDKVLSDVKAVQTLSRLNRCHPDKQDTFVLDFANTAEDIKNAFQRFYKTTILGEEQDVDKLDDLVEVIETIPFYLEEELEEVVRLKVMETEDRKPDIYAIIDRVVLRFESEDNKDWQVRVKSAIKNYCRFYPFIASISPFITNEWEKHYIFYYLLLKKLPKLGDDDLTEGLLESIDLSHYQLRRNEECHIRLDDEDTEVGAVPVGTHGQAQPDMMTLEQIIELWNQAHGNIISNIPELVNQINELPEKFMDKTTLINAVRHSDEATAKRQFNDDMEDVMVQFSEDKMEFSRLWMTNSTFQEMATQWAYLLFVERLKGKGEIHLHGTSSINTSGDVSIDNANINTFIQKDN